MRVRVEFEAEATRGEPYDCYYVEVPALNNTRIIASLSSECVTVLSVEEPKEPGSYAVQYADLSCGTVAKTFSGYWYVVSSERKHTWEELGNIVKVKRLDYNAILD